MKRRPVFLMCLFSVLFFSCTKTVPLPLLGESLVPLSDTASSCAVLRRTKGDTLFYRFTEQQISALADRAVSAEGLSLVLRLSKNDEAEKESVTFYAGFLYADDFDGKGTLVVDMDARPEVSGVLSDELLPVADISLCMEGDVPIPAGFFVKGEQGLSLLSADVSPARIGFDRSGEVPLYAFGPSGGGVDVSSTTVDFSGAGGICSQPKIVIRKYPTADIGTADSQLTIRGSYAGEEFAVRCSPVSDVITLQTAAFERRLGVLSFSSHEELVASVLLCANESRLAPSADGRTLYPLVSDIGLVVDYPQSHWRAADYELFRWEEFPDVLVFDTASYAVQDQFFTRLAYFVEKTGYKGTFVSDSFILSAHGYNAHDYKADDLARFFTQAAAQGVRLNASETLLRDILTANGIIVQEGEGSYAAGKGAVISFSKESPSYLRYQLIAHEGWHGIYFGDEDFRDTVAMCYLMFDPVSLDFLKTYWGTYESLLYDTSDEYLMRNEFMAYHLQQTTGQIAGYFVTRAKWNSVQRTQKANADYIISTDAEAFYDTALMLSDYVFGRWGLCAGRVWNVSR